MTILFAGLGQDVVIYPLAKITNRETIFIGNAVIIDDFVFIHSGDRTVIGDFVHIAAMTLIAGGGVVEIEDFACVSGGVRIYAGTDDFLGGSMIGPAIPYPYRQPIRSFVRICRHAVVGTSAIILPGVTIGEGAAIGAGTVVLHDCDPWTIYVGNPAKAINVCRNDKVLAYAQEFRRIAYDKNGRYIPKEERETA